MVTYKLSNNRSKEISFWYINSNLKNFLMCRTWQVLTGIVLYCIWFCACTALMYISSMLVGRWKLQPKLTCKLFFNLEENNTLANVCLNTNIYLLIRIWTHTFICQQEYVQILCTIITVLKVLHHDYKSVLNKIIIICLLEYIHLFVNRSRCK